jgi:thiol:disulfide interchange protein DsbD
LRAAGRAVGWGFQLQNPIVVTVLAYLLFALGLSMSGVFSFGTRWMGIGQRLTELGGVRGSFFTGVLAVVVASPCTVPFMGAATGFALTQPPALALLVFVALGLGLAAPFLLLGFVPALGARLPRPGAWMDTFKQLLAFPLYLSSAWLVWVLARQVGADGAGVALFGLVLIALSLWSAGRHAPIFHVISIVAVIAALALLGTAPLRSTSAPTTMTAAGGVQPYSADRLAKLRAQHRIVFVNFTADWCLTCKVNESVALESARVQDAFRTHNVVWLEGDWTRYDPSITQVLQQFGRSGVPLYLLYDGDSTPRVLPQLLTPDVVLEALGALPLASGGTTPSAAPQPPA